MDLLESWPIGDVALRDRLLAAYDDPGRGYHDLRHLTEVVHNIQLLRGELPRPPVEAAMWPPPHQHAVLLAAWFHDAVYDGERDAEERSAAWAEEALPGLVDEATVTEVARLVRLTESHRPDDGDVNGCALSDADLGILAAPEERYDDYAAAVRTEYAHLSDEVFTAGRAEVLRELMAKPRLFHTAYGLAQWEEPARRNVARELSLLPA